VVVPVYGGGALLPELAERVNKVAQGESWSYELILVDDCGTGNAWDTIQDLITKGFPIVGIRMAGNHGQHKAILAGLGAARGEFVAILDDDLQTEPEALPLLQKRQEVTQADLVYAIYTRRAHAWPRRYASNLLASVGRVFGSTPGWGSSFKWIRGSLTRQITQAHYQEIYLDEVLMWHAGRLERVTVPHARRKGGKSGYSALRLLRMALGVVFFYTSLPLRLMVFVGLLASTTSFGFGTYFIYRKVFFEVPLGFTTLIVAIFFSFGILISSLGVIGEYLRRIYLSQLGKPPYRVAEKRSFTPSE
jgi:glycosyltransferase involved in cell wall biosynthesis